MDIHHGNRFDFDFLLIYVYLYSRYILISVDRLDVPSVRDCLASFGKTVTQVVEDCLRPTTTNTYPQVIDVIARLLLALVGTNLNQCFFRADKAKPQHSIKKKSWSPTFASTSFHYLLSMSSVDFLVAFFFAFAQGTVVRCFKHEPPSYTTLLTGRLKKRRFEAKRAIPVTP